MYVQKCGKAVFYDMEDLYLANFLLHICFCCFFLLLICLEYISLF